MKAGNASAMVDVVPERYPYRDEGCDVSSSCLRCPLPQCKYDDPGWFHRQRRDRRDDEVIEAMREGGLSVADLAARFAGPGGPLRPEPAHRVPHPEKGRPGGDPGRPFSGTCLTLTPHPDVI